MTCWLCGQVNDLQELKFQNGNSMWLCVPHLEEIKQVVGSISSKKKVKVIDE